jgi:hypothetical protein
MSILSLFPKRDKIKIIGTVHDFQTELRFIRNYQGIMEPIDTGIVTWEKKYKNTVHTPLLNHLAHRIAANTNNYAMDNLFTSQGTEAAVGTAMNGFDGIFHYNKDDVEQIEHILLTTLNVGGAGVTAYSEFYGYINGAVTLNHYLGVGYNYIDATTLMTAIFAYTAITTTVAANRRFHRYWRFTFS